MIRILLKIVVGLCLFVALLICGIWAFLGVELEPWVTLMALVAVVLGLIIDPLLATRARRRGLLRDLAHELMRNLNVIRDEIFRKQDGKFNMYPRISTAVTESVLSSGLFSSGKDEKLVKLLHDWHGKGGELNNRLTMTEHQTVNSPEKDRKRWQVSLAKGKTFISIKTALVDLAKCLIEDYEVETSIGRETVIFGGNDKEKK